MRGHTKASAAFGAMLAAAACGCRSEGLSPREGGRQSYGMVMYTASAPSTGGTTMYTSSPTPPAPGGPIVVATTAAPVQTPAKIAVAQMGELTPPVAMMDELRRHHELFRRVVPVAGSFNAAGEDAFARYHSADGSSTAPTPDPVGTDALARMRTLAAQQGLEYLLVFGGQIDHGNQGSGLQLLDLTIVGAFVVPSHGVTVDGKAAGSLVDVRTGQIVMNFAAQSRGTGTAPSAFVDNVEQGAVLKNKDELIQKLTADVVSQMTDEMRYNAGR